MLKVFLLSLLFLYYVDSLFAQSYGSTFPHTSWKDKLSKQIKNKSLQTLEGTAQIPDQDGGSILGRGNQYTVDNPKRNEHLAWGGLYFFSLQINHNKRIQVITTRLMGMINQGQRIRVTGAYDAYGNFIARTVVNLNTNHTAAKW